MAFASAYAGALRWNEPFESFDFFLRSILLDEGDRDDDDNGNGNGYGIVVLQHHERDQCGGEQQQNHRFFELSEVLLPHGLGVVDVEIVVPVEFLSRDDVLLIQTQFGVRLKDLDDFTGRRTARSVRIQYRHHTMQCW